MKLSTYMKDALLDRMESVIGQSPRLLIFSGLGPSVALTATGNLLFSIQLPSDWLNNAANGVKYNNVPWSGTALRSGSFSDNYYWRIVTGANVTHIQGVKAEMPLLSGGPTFVTGQTLTFGLPSVTFGWSTNN